MLHRKMFRDIKNNLSQFVTIFLMVLIGVMAYAGIESYMDGMTNTANKFYTENNLQDLNLVGKNFTTSDIDMLKDMDNINDAERKLSLTGTTDNEKTLLLNFIESNNISKFYIIDGDKFDNKDGVWLDEKYAKENKIKVGDTILVKYDDISINQEVRALVNIPDHLYDVRDQSEIYPDRKEFGFAYLSVDTLANEIGYDNIVFTSVMVDVKDKSKIDQTKLDIEDNIKNAQAIINIEDTLSYGTYQGEIDEGKTFIGVFSGIFIFIAMLSVITTMTRVVKQQRIQIGTLKALGFRNYKILLHYIGYGFWVSLMGAIGGLILGYFFIGNTFMSLEMDFFEIPNGHPVLRYDSFLVAALVVLAVCIITYLTCRKILKENAAETLRNKIPNVKKNSLNITTKGIFKKLGFSSIWNIRDIIRNKVRTIMGICGCSGCAMLIVCAVGMFDSVDNFIDLQFEKIYNFNYKLTFTEDINEYQLESIYDKYGNHTSKSYGIEIKKDGKRESNNIVITDAGNYLRFIDEKNNYIKVDSDEGVYITHKLAKNNNYKIGDKITWHIYGDDTYHTSKIVGFNKDPQNQNITMTRKYFESLGYPYVPDSLYTNEKISKNEEIAGVETIQDINSLKDGMVGMISMLKTMLVLLIFIAIVLGAVIIYNLGILSYMEKQYQFATLKVLGFRDKQIKKVFIKQNNWIAIISIIIGLLLGFYLTDFLFKVAIDDKYDFEAHIKTITYVLSAVGTFTASYLVSIYLARKIKKIDMVTSLKGNE